MPPIAAWFHPDQLLHHPTREWHDGAVTPHPESPERLQRIYEALCDEPRCTVQPTTASTPARLLASVIDPRLWSLYQLSASLPEGCELHPTVFSARPPRAVSSLHELGAFARDTYAPLTRHTFRAVQAAADTAWSAARALSAGHRLSYAACRPPGHHASRTEFGGYCYVNQAVIAARELCKRGPVAVIDLDVHHGNGTQALLWRSSRCLLIDLHRDTTHTYPYFSGHADEVGAGPGRGHTLNLPLPPGTDAPHYLRTLHEEALHRLRAFGPVALVISAGFDTYHLDPLADFTLRTADYEQIGALLGGLGLPTCVIQEGGYYLPDLGHNAIALLSGLHAGQRGAGVRR